MRANGLNSYQPWATPKENVTSTVKGLKVRLHLLGRDAWVVRAFSPLAGFVFKPRPTLVPRFDLG